MTPAGKFMENKITLAVLKNSSEEHPVIKTGPFWECVLCTTAYKLRTIDVTAMMIHLLMVHRIEIEWQDFPGGILQAGKIFAMQFNTRNKI